MASEYDGSPVHLEPLASERLRPVSVRRKKVSTEIRVDATRVSGPIRVILEPLLWIAFAVGFLWLLIAFDPALRSSAVGGPVVYEYALPLAVLVSVLLLVATVSALVWLPTSTSAVRSRTAFAGLGLLGSAWLFTQLNPVEAHDLENTSRFCFAVGAILIGVCCVPWPTRPAPRVARVSALRAGVAVVVAVVFAAVCYQVWQSAADGLVGTDPEGQDGWSRLLPYLGAMVLLLAGARHLLVRPERVSDADEYEETEEPVPAPQ
ncbi:hypothetical protein [Nocardioides yefusunii]|uniref:DUF998 domain-containing protein n=1 Tax=Nocardioides yefusunii TaxID=2500546 RepID=A0ABW1QW62_9ACTN|nr:hypothetical protein [Nocardioides yefusunii]